MAELQITVLSDGPYKVQGPVTLLDAEGNRFEVDRETVFLCRCGGSSSKPFCDGTHSRIGFTAATRAVSEPGAQPFTQSAAAK